MDNYKINKKLFFADHALFLLHLIGCLWTSDFDYAIKDLTIKLPLLILPIIIGTSKRFTVQEWKTYCSFILELSS